jgi:hypothetical protein
MAAPTYEILAESTHVERIGLRLLGWKGKLLNRVGMLTLVTTVLSSKPTYHLTVFPLAV